MTDNVGRDKLLFWPLASWAIESKPIQAQEIIVVMAYSNVMIIQLTDDGGREKSLLDVSFYF